jgi:hypothetical protein
LFVPALVPAAIIASPALEDFWQSGDTLLNAGDVVDATLYPRRFNRNAFFPFPLKNLDG